MFDPYPVLPCFHGDLGLGTASSIRKETAGQAIHQKFCPARCAVHEQGSSGGNDGHHDGRRLVVSVVVADLGGPVLVFGIWPALIIGWCGGLSLAFLLGLCCPGGRTTLTLHRRIVGTARAGGAGQDGPSNTKHE